MKKLSMVIFFCQSIFCASGPVHTSFETLEAEEQAVDDRIASLSHEIKQLNNRKQELKDQRLELQTKLILK